ncbi:hypothetical protein GCM10009837_41540 [Streptomyces durmitorensis]
MTLSRRLLTVWPCRPYRRSLPLRRVTDPLRVMAASARPEEGTVRLRAAGTGHHRATGAGLPRVAACPLEAAAYRLEEAGGRLSRRREGRPDGGAGCSSCSP